MKPPAPETWWAILAPQQSAPDVTFARLNGHPLLYPTCAQAVRAMATLHVRGRPVRVTIECDAKQPMWAMGTVTD